MTEQQIRSAIPSLVVVTLLFALLVATGSKATFPVLDLVQIAFLALIYRRLIPQPAIVLDGKVNQS